MTQRPGSSDLALSRIPHHSQGAEKAQALAPGLYVVATPIGHARDLSFRGLDVLSACDLVAAEDTRNTAKLFAIHGISRPLVSYNDHNAARERPKLVARLKAGARIALVSDAGTPLISDPGFKLVRDVIAQDIDVYAVPGASALLAALAVAGLPTDRFLFAGFLPAKAGERRAALEELKTVPATLVFYESPQRLAQSLGDMAEILGMRAAAVARELTKLHEDVRRAPLPGLAGHYAASGAPKGEVTIVVAPPEKSAPDLSRADRLLAQALSFMPVRAAADLVADALDLPRRAIYARALARKKEKDDG